MSKNSVRPKILIDARSLSPSLHGISRFVLSSARGLKEVTDSTTPYEPVFLVNQAHHDFARAVLGFSVVPCESHFPSVKEWFEIPRLISREGAVLYHSPSLASLPWCPVPWIITLHDLIHLDYSGMAQRVYYHTVLRRFLEGAERVLSVSDATGQRLRTWLGKPEFSVEVTPNAIDPSFSESLSPEESYQALGLLARLGLEKGKFFLILSNSKRHKNVEFLFESLGTRWPSGWKVASTVTPEHVSMGSKFVGLKGLSSTDVRILLQSAGALLFPSLEEGFGLPPLEALASGTPVVLSDIAPHREGIRNLPQETQRALEPFLTWCHPRRSSEWEHAVVKFADPKLGSGVPEPVRHQITSTYSNRELGLRLDRVYRSVLESITRNK